jgi:hypothetical protein
MKDDTFIYLITFGIFTVTVIFLLIEYVFKKWKCNEGKCEKVILGDYSTIKECIESKECNKNTEPTSSSVENNVPVQQTLTGYDCVNQKCTGNYKGTHGYTNENECMNNCGNNKTPITVLNTLPNYSYGYPYSGLYPYGTNYNSMWSHRRRSPRRHGSPIHRRRHGRSPRRSHSRD